MKKFLMKALMVFGIAGLGILAGAVLLPSGAYAQGTNPAGGFGTTQGAGLATANNIGGGTGVTLMTIIKSFINWVLGLLSLIALGMCLWGGFQMVTAAGDDAKYKGGFKILKQAAVGLIVVGLSWIIVSTIFTLIGGAAQGKVGDGI